jgi:hypothetical protein
LTHNTKENYNSLEEVRKGRAKFPPKIKASKEERKMMRDM